MPRVRPDDFHVLLNPFYGTRGDRGPVWARWWRHRDGTVSSVHYNGRDGSIITTSRHDPGCRVFDRYGA